MTFTIALGWWIAPTLVTLFCLYMFFRPDKNNYGNNWIAWGIGQGIEAMFRILWAIPALIAWLIYFIFN